MNNEIYLFYFPLKICLFDDDLDFIDLIKTKINIPNKINIFTSTNVAAGQVNFIEFNIKELIQQNFIDVYDLNFEGIYNFIKTNEDQYGIIVCDYLFPNEINGIEFITKLKIRDEILKILFTNIYQVQDALTAMNEQKINYYLAKYDINKINNTISTLEKKLFQKINLNILNFIDKTCVKKTQDSSFINLFNEITTEYNIIKYYILNNNCDFHLENHMGGKYKLLSIALEDWENFKLLQNSNHEEYKLQHNYYYKIELLNE